MITEPGSWLKLAGNTSLLQTQTVEPEFQGGAQQSVLMRIQRLSECENRRAEMGGAEEPDLDFSEDLGPEEAQGSGKEGMSRHRPRTTSTTVSTLPIPSDTYLIILESSFCRQLHCLE